MRTYFKRLRNREERGAAIVEFAIALPMFIGLLLLVFDAGLGYSASRSSSAAARSGARVGALAGDSRDADFRVLDALRAQFGRTPAEGDDGGANTIVVYVSNPANSNGAPPAGCTTSSIPGVCNRYDASILESLSMDMFTSTVLPDGTVICSPSAPDAAWCPLTRRLNDGSFLGVYVASVYDTTTGLEATAFNLEDRAVFSLYFPPEPITLGPDGLPLIDPLLAG